MPFLLRQSLRWDHQTTKAGCWGPESREVSDRCRDRYLALFGHAPQAFTFALKPACPPAQGRNPTGMTSIVSSTEDSLTTKLGTNPDGLWRDADTDGETDTTSSTLVVSRSSGWTRVRRTAGVVVVGVTSVGLEAHPLAGRLRVAEYSLPKGLILSVA